MTHRSKLLDLAACGANDGSHKRLGDEHLSLEGQLVGVSVLLHRLVMDTHIRRGWVEQREMGDSWK